MEWLVQIAEMSLTTLAWMAGFAVAFGVLSKFMPCNRGMYWWSNLNALATDLLYWFAMPVVLRSCRTWLLAVGVSVLFAGATPGFDAVRALPIWVQCVGILIVQDVLLYWIHRAFHTRLAWSFHAVHHSSTTLDWMSATRFHLVNHVLSFVLADVIVLLAGFSMEALLVLVPFNIIYSSMVHANLNWTFGPLRYVFASPVFHRWHHVAEGEGINKNFASTFPILDLLFGTYYMPVNQVPERFGNGEADFPDDFWGQMIYQFQLKIGSSALPREREAEILTTEAQRAQRNAIGMEESGDFSVPIHTQ